MGDCSLENDTEKMTIAVTQRVWVKLNTLKIELSVKERRRLTYSDVIEFLISFFEKITGG